MMTEGRIIRSISGFYDVWTPEGIRRLRAKGSFRKKHITPLVGDAVRVSEGLIEEICERKNELVRPRIANVDQAILVLAAKYPEPSFLLLERFIAQVRACHVTPVLVVNKQDQLEGMAELPLLASYRRAGFTALTVSTKTGVGIEVLKQQLVGKVSVLAGPSGVGKSSLLNAIGLASRETGELSEKIQRGKNTTRVSELLAVPGLDAWVADTPGFTSLEVHFKNIAELQALYTEWQPMADRCAYEDCTHRNEPGCAVREGVAAGRIEQVRYDGYLHLLTEVKETYE